MGVRDRGERSSPLQPPPKQRGPEQKPHTPAGVNPARRPRQLHCHRLGWARLGAAPMRSRSGGRCGSPPGSYRRARQGEDTAPAAACSAQHSPAGPSGCHPARPGMPRGRGSARRLGTSPEPGDVGRQLRGKVLGSLGNRTFGREAGGKHLPSRNKNKILKSHAGSCRLLSSPPPRAALPSLPAQAPRDREATGISLPAGVTSAAACPAASCSCSSSSSPPSSSSLPLPAAWGSLWRFIHSCLPIGPSAFPCLPEAERVTPRPFPATFCCHTAALPQPGGAAELGHAWEATGRGSVPQRGAEGVGGRGHWEGAYRRPLAPVAGASGRPQGSLRCPPPAPSGATPLPIAGRHKAAATRGGDRSRTPGQPPGNPRSLFPSLLAPSTPTESVLPPAASAPAAEPHLAPRSAAPSAQLTKALTQARRGAPDSGVGSRGSLARRKLPPPASSSLCALGRTPPSRGLLAPPGHRAKSIPAPAFPRTRVPPLPSAACPPAALRGGLGTHSRSPSTASRCPLPAAARTPRQAGARPGCLGGCKTREVPGSDGRGADGEQF